MQHRTFRRYAVLFSSVRFCRLHLGLQKEGRGHAARSGSGSAALQPTVTLNASPSSVNPGQTVDAVLVVDERHRPRYRAGHRQGRAARLDPGQSDELNHLHHHGHGAGRQRHGHRAAWTSAAAADAAPLRRSAAERERALRAERQGCILRSRQVRASRRRSRCSHQGCGVPAFVSRRAHLDRRTLRRARLDGIQPRSGPESRRGGEELSSSRSAFPPTGWKQ